MRICEAEGCFLRAQKHHIVFRSQGGFDIPINFKYLCPEHHTGKNSPHGNKRIDIAYKREMQEKLFRLFSAEGYTLAEIVNTLKHDKRNVEKRIKKVANIAGVYKREDIVRAVMGGKLY